MRLFAYGTLMDRTKPADDLLKGFVLGIVGPGMRFPGIVPQAGGRVYGQLVDPEKIPLGEGLSGDLLWRRFDEYEAVGSGLYRRILVEVQLADGEGSEVAYAYEFIDHDRPLYLPPKFERWWDREQDDFIHPRWREPDWGVIACAV